MVSKIARLEYELSYWQTCHHSCEIGFPGSPSPMPCNACKKVQSIIGQMHAEQTRLMEENNRLLKAINERANNEIGNRD